MAPTPEPLSKNPNAGYFWGADVCLLIADAWRWQQKKSAHTCSEGRISQKEGMREPGIFPTASKAPTSVISIFYLLLQGNGTKWCKNLVYRKIAPLSLSCSLWKSVNLVFSENTHTPYLTQHKEPINSSLRDIWQSYKKWGEKPIPLKKNAKKIQPLSTLFNGFFFLIWLNPKKIIFSNRSFQMPSLSALPRGSIYLIFPYIIPCYYSLLFC